MPKNIILLSDGTGNSASKLFKTNVWRLYQALDLSETPGKPQQIAWYDDGVGTSSFKPLAILGGAFGWGTKRIVLDLYTFLCRQYQPDDSIYGFGFSRGAFAIRLLTALISTQGLVQAETESELRRLAAEAFREYRRENYPRRTLLTWLFRQLRNVILWLWYKVTRKTAYKKAANWKAPTIKFLGLWDTVAAYGLPIDELTHAWNFLFPLAFPNHQLSDIVDCAHHALALDDERLTFHPELWNEHASDYKKRPLGNRLTQVWFAGMHSNVGGGYPDDALSYVPLNWIMDKAAEEGLVFLPAERDRLRDAADCNGRMYDSRQGLGGAYRYMPRKLKALTHDVRGRNNRILIDTSKIHESVFTRINNRILGYAPIGLPESYEVVGPNGAIQPQTETPQQAKGRINRQTKVWNLVWWKRLVYFMSVGVFGLLAAFPLFGRPTPLPYDGSLYIVSAGISSIGTFLPDFLSPWLKAYQSHPALFLLIMFLFVAILYLGGRLQGKLFDQMRRIFNQPGPAKVRSGLIYRVRSNQRLKKSLKWLKEKLIPALILIIILMFIPRGLFAIIDASGLTCTPTPADLKSYLVKGESRTKNFDSKSLCWPSGVEVEAGKHYKITLVINQHDQWLDRKTPARVSGVEKKDLSFFMYLALPLRRHLMEPWFKPIARIGLSGRDDYPLNPEEWSGSTDNQLIAVIEAHRSGELFLFVNDAVLPVPNAWQGFYGNNPGTADVTIERLD